ncbi:family 78 glycoside hydrolase catalytic domain [Maribellus sp. YY47]|uniref:family 78 glycoside hydrolase catalytic domain n=1 Tax=Maribellus sp. YY47 TaxID=2929486 RepID=UPI002001A1A5|nr:family 78 glycoside hydrolase catalytic domain [Maribellus sp. YY47]MCK3684738.1 glycoside hydrolase family 78 protein [Maribellus sp. YY47]
MNNKLARKKHFHFSLFITLFIFLFTSCTSEKIKIEDMTCEYNTQPKGIDVQSPRFSWKIASTERSILQASFRIIVSEEKNEVLGKSGDSWDSGRVESSNTINITYEGSTLKSNRDYFWRVCIQTKNGEEIWSKPARFHTAFFSASDWKADWITTSEEIIHQSPFFRKDFEIAKKVKQAFAYVTAGGFYEFSLNGEKVGDHVLDPSITDYRKRILYSTYDVTENLKPGTNVAGLILANGAYNMRKVADRYSWGGGNVFGNPSFIAQLNITYEDGSQEVIVSDPTWKYANGPITFNNLFGGEDYNAQLEIPGWNTKDFQANNWKNAILATKPGGQLVSQLNPPVKVTETLEPVKQTQPSEGVYLFDLGQNIAGWWKIEVKGKAGQVIRIRGSETLNNELFPKNLEEGDKYSDKFRFHSHVWTDYTLKGEELETYEPRFFYSGFRYIEVATSDKKALDEIKVAGRVVRSSMELNGTFESSDLLLNQIHTAGLWSQKGNLVFYPTDCPHREKGAYNGDGQVIAETSIHNFEMASLYTKWVNDMRDSQEENGRIPNTSPVLVGGMGGGVAWGSAYILIPWWMNHYYNDNRILEDHYPAMKRYTDYLSTLAKTDNNPDEPYIINDFLSYWYSLGEWCAPGQNDCPNHPVVNTFYYYYNTKTMAEIAKLLGKTADAEKFSSRCDTIKQAFNDKFFNTETYLYGTDSTFQTYQLLALAGDIIPDGYREGVVKTVVDDIKKRGNHLNTGIIGTKYLWPILVQEGYSDLAYKVATQKTYPGYGFWLENNSTTLLEHWSGNDSHNHEMFGSVVEYFYKYLAGIQSPVEGLTTKGYNHIQLQPYTPDGLDFVNASLETMSGKIISNWEKKDDGFHYKVSIPGNTTATIVFPDKVDQNATLSENQQIVWKNNKTESEVKGITKIEANSGQLVISVESGDYDFHLTNL